MPHPQPRQLTSVFRCLWFRLFAATLLLSTHAAGAAETPIVAVLPFQGGPQVGQEAGDRFAETLLTDLQQSDLVRCVERSRIEDVMAELRLQMSGFVDDSTARQLGKLYGASWLVTGSIQREGQAFRANLRAIDAETAEVLLTARATQGNLFALQDAASRRILRAFRMRLSRQLRLRPELLQIATGDSEVRAVAFDPLSTRLAYGTADGAVYLHGLERTSAPDYLGQLPGAVRALAFDETGPRLAAAGADGTARVWDLTTRAVLQSLAKHKGGALSLDFAPTTGELAVATGKGEVAIWHVASGRSLAKMSTRSGFFGGSKEMRLVAYLDDGRQLLTAREDLKLQFWNRAQPKRPKRQLADDTQRGELFTAAVSPRGSLIAVGIKDIEIDLRRNVRTDREYVRLLDAVTGEEIRKYEGHDQAITALSFGPDQRLLASGSLDQQIKIWDAQQALELLSIDANAPVLAVAFSADGRTLAAGARDGSMQIWSLH